MAEKLIGAWKAFKHENLEPVFDAMKAEHEKREWVRTDPITVHVEKTGNGFRLLTKIGEHFKRDVTFPLGQEVDTIDLTGQPVTAVLTVDGQSLRELQKASRGDTIITRTVTEAGHLVTTITQALSQKVKGEIFLEKTK